MTTQSAAISAFRPATGNPALTASLAVTVIAAATIAGAWFFQLEEPGARDRRCRDHGDSQRGGQRGIARGGAKR